MNKDYGHYPLPKILNDVKRDLRKHILNKLKIYKIIDDFKKKLIKDLENIMQ